MDETLTIRLQNQRFCRVSYLHKVKLIYEAREILKKELLEYHSSLKEAIEAKNRCVRVQRLVENCKGVFEKFFLEE